MHHLLKAVTIALLAVSLSAALVSRVPAAAVEATPEATTAADCDTQPFIDNVEFSSNGKLMVAGWGTGKYKVWDIESGQLLHEFQVGKAEGTAVASFSADDRYMATIDYDAATVWDMNSFEKVGTVPFLKNQMGALRAYFTPDDHFLVTMMNMGASLWDIRSGKKIHDYPAYGQTYQGFSHLSPDGKYILMRNMAENDTLTWELWDVQRGERIHEFESANAMVAFSPNSETIAIDQDEGLILWDIETRATHVLNLQSNYPPSSWSFSSDSQLLLTPFQDTKAALWDVQTGALKHVFDDVLLWGSVFSPDSESLLLIDKPNDQHTDTHLTIWHLKDYRMSKELSLPIEKDFFATRVSSDLRYLVAWSHHDIELWSLETGEVLRRFC